MHPGQREPEHPEHQGARNHEHRHRHELPADPPPTRRHLARRRRLVGRTNRAKGAGVLAQPALDALVRRDPHPPLRDLRQPPEQHPVRAQEAAVGAPHEQPDGQDAAAEDQHRCVPAPPEEGDERVVVANDERTARRRQHDRQRQVDHGQHPQPLLQPPRHPHRPHQHEILHRPQRADRRTEGPPEQQREGQRQQEEGQHRQRHGVARVEDPEHHVLHRPHGAHAALPPEAEVRQRRQHQDEEPSPRPHLQGVEGRQHQRHEQHRHVQVLEGDGPRRRVVSRGEGVPRLEVGRREALGAQSHAARHHEEHEHQDGDAGSQGFGSSPCGRSGWPLGWMSGRDAGTRRNAWDGHAAAMEHSLQFRQRSWRTWR